MYLFNQEFKSNIMSCMLCLRKSFMSSHSRQDLCFFLWHLLVFYHFFLLYTSKSGLAQVHMLAAEQGKVEEHLYHRIQYTSSTHNLPFLPSKSAVDYSSLHTVWHVRGTGGSLSPILISLSAHLVEPALGKHPLLSPTPVLGVNSAQRCTRCILFTLIPLRGQIAIWPFDSVLFGIGTLSSSWM